MKISAIITLKNDVLDPQGKAIQQTLNGMGYSNVQGVRQGKFFDLEIKLGIDFNNDCLFSFILSNAPAFTNPSN